MSFSDEDLKQLKLEIEIGGILWKGSFFKPLLDRLDYAERTVRHFAPYISIHKLDDCQTYQAWRKSKGDQP